MVSKEPTNKRTKKVIVIYKSYIAGLKLSKKFDISEIGISGTEQNLATMSQDLIRVSYLP